MGAVPPSPTSQMECRGCGKTLVFPSGSQYVRCPVCELIANPLAPSQGHVNCIRCGIFLAHPSSCSVIQCPKCYVVMEVTPKRPPPQQRQTAKQTGSKRRKRDPKLPRKASNAYMIFCKEQRPRLRGAEPGLKFGQIGSRLGRIWMELSPEGKRPYEAKADADRVRYSKEMESYNGTAGAAASSTLLASAQAAAAAEPPTKRARIDSRPTVNPSAPQQPVSTNPSVEMPVSVPPASADTNGDAKTRAAAEAAGPEPSPASPTTAQKPPAAPEAKTAQEPLAAQEAKQTLSPQVAQPQNPAAAPTPTHEAQQMAVQEPAEGQPEASGAGLAPSSEPKAPPVETPQAPPTAPQGEPRPPQQ